LKRPLLTAALALVLPLTAAPARLTEPVAASLSAPGLVPSLTDAKAPPASLAPIPIALLVDLGSGQVLYSREPDRRFMPASITKVMTLYVAFELISRGQLDPNTVLTMSAGAQKQWRGVGSTMFLDSAHPASVRDLLLGIANVSANDGCVVLAEGVAGTVPNWTALMNAEARKLGMKDSHFNTPNGWMDDGQTYVSAHDLATLATAILTRHPDLYHEYIGHEVTTWNGITQHNHDPILGKLEGADGIKTGFTNQAGYGFLGSAVRGGRRLIMVIAGVAQPKDRAHAAADLMDWGFAAFDSRPLFSAGAAVGTARVQGGEAREVPLIAPVDYAASSARGTRDPVSLAVVYDGPLEAPIKKGSVVASLEIKVGAGKAERVPLVAGADVARAGSLTRLINGFWNLFG
jgi:D-alanyl-D-alanine carboxypeptidase (penicillin-binding protein 5/6)